MATSYGTRAEADTYFSARGIEAWGAASEPARDAVLIRASSYIDGRYRDRFPGRKTGGRAQVREWPRADVVDASGEPIAEDEVPIEIEHATYEAALRELSDPGSLAPDFMPGEVVKSEKVGPIAMEYAVPDDAASARPVVTVIEDILSAILTAPTARKSVSYLLRA